MNSARIKNFIFVSFALPFHFLFTVRSRSINTQFSQTIYSAYSSIKCLYREIFGKLQHESNEVVIFMRAPNSMRADGRTDRRDALWCNVTGRGLVGHRLDMTWVRVLRLCYQTTTEADLLLEGATTIICTVESSLSTVER